MLKYSLFFLLFFFSSASICMKTGLQHSPRSYDLQEDIEENNTSEQNDTSEENEVSISICIEQGLQHSPRSYDLQKNIEENDNHEIYYISDTEDRETHRVIVRKSKKSKCLKSFFYFLTCRWCCKITPDVI